MKKVMLVFGTRPEAIKMCPLVKEFQKRTDEFETIVCVTGQHREMLDQVLKIFEVTPDIDLNIMKQGQDLTDVTVRILTGMRDVFKENKSFAANASLHKNYQSRRVPDSDPSFTPVDKGSVLDLTDAANQGAVTPANNADVTYDSGRKALKLTAKGADPNVKVSFSSLGTMSTTKYKTLIIEYMIPTTNGEANCRCDLFVCAGSVTNATPDCCVRKDLIMDGQFHTLEVDLSGYDWWTGNLNSIRFDFLDAVEVGDVVFVKTIGLK